MKVSFFTLIQGSYLAVLACKQEQIAFEAGNVNRFREKKQIF